MPPFCKDHGLAAGDSQGAERCAGALGQHSPSVGHHGRHAGAVRWSLAGSAPQAEAAHPTVPALRAAVTEGRPVPADYLTGSATGSSSH